MNFYEQIDDYLRDSLSSDQRAAFEDAMKEDPELRGAVRMHELRIAAIQDEAHEAIVAARKRLKEGDEGKLGQPAKVIKLRPWKQFGRVAAGIAFMVISGAFTYSNLRYSTQNIVNHAYVMPQDLSTEQSGNDLISKRDSILAEWKEGNALDAINRSELFLSENPENQIVRYDLANFYFQTRQYDKAGNMFEQLLDDRRFKDAAEFTMALCQIKLDNTNEGKTALREISKNPNHTYSEKSADVLSRFGSVWHSLALN